MADQDTSLERDWLRRWLGGAQASEARVALALTLFVLVVLWGAKSIGSIPWVGPFALTVAAIIQLYLPLWRAGFYDADLDWAGLTFSRWREDLRWVGVLALLTFPPYIVGHHLYVTQAHEWLWSAGLHKLAAFVPTRFFSPSLPDDLAGWSWCTWHWFEIVATHTLGVALPEETFYRGYLQPKLEAHLPPRAKVAGVLIGRAAVLAALLFAIGHVVGEWNPLRMGPFFPALLFAWQRNKTGTVMGAITFHALCNILGEVLFSLYDAS